MKTPLLAPWVFPAQRYGRFLRISISRFPSLVNLVKYDCYSWHACPFFLPSLVSSSHYLDSSLYHDAHCPETDEVKRIGGGETYTPPNLRLDRRSCPEKKRSERKGNTQHVMTRKLYFLRKESWLAVKTPYKICAMEEMP